MQNVFKFAKANQLAEELDRSQCFFVDLPLTETRSDGEEFALGHFKYIHELFKCDHVYIRFLSWAFTKRIYTLCLEQVLGKNVFKKRSYVRKDVTHLILQFCSIFQPVI